MFQLAPALSGFVLVNPPDETPDVLSHLPRSRPQRRSAKRGARPAAGAPATPRSKTAPRTTRARPIPPPPETAPPRAAQAPVPIEPPTGTELLEGAVKAAGEVASLGLAVGRQALESVFKRLPRP